MATLSENTPLLTRDDRLTGHDETQNGHSKPSSKKSQLKFAINISRLLISLLSFSLFGILLATHILITNGWHFDYVANSEQAVRIFTTIVLVNFILCTLTVFLQTPSVFNIPLNITMSVVLLIFSDHLLGVGWPDAVIEGYPKIFCRPIWRGPNDLWVDPKCEHARDVIKILMGVSAGIGILIALLLVAVLLLELTALGRGETKIGAGSAPAGAANTLLNGEEA
ncbi:hypothetical protein V8E51_018480 [Hyaloscypha variabilis]